MLQFEGKNWINLNRILPGISDSISIDIRLRSTIESQSFDCVQMYSIDSIGILVRFRSIDIVFWIYGLLSDLYVHIWSWRTKNKMARQNSQKESMTSFWRIKNKMYGRWFTLATLWHKIEDYQHFIMKMKDFQFFISDEVQITPNIFSLKRSQKHVL